MFITVQKKKITKTIKNKFPRISDPNTINFLLEMVLIKLNIKQVGKMGVVVDSLMVKGEIQLYRLPTCSENQNILITKAKPIRSFFKIF